MTDSNNENEIFKITPYLKSFTHKASDVLVAMVHHHVSKKKT